MVGDNPFYCFWRQKHFHFSWGKSLRKVWSIASSISVSHTRNTPERVQSRFHKEVKNTGNISFNGKFGVSLKYSV